MKYEIKNIVSLAGSNVSQLNHLSKQKYISKKEMRKLLQEQINYLEQIKTITNDSIY